MRNYGDNCEPTLSPFLQSLGKQIKIGVYHYILIQFKNVFSIQSSANVANITQTSNITY